MYADDICIINHIVRGQSIENIINMFAPSV